MKFLLLFGILTTFMFGAVDINNASKSKLQELTYVGPATAEKIIQYRESNCFKSADDMANVKGIGPKTIEKNRENIKIGECMAK